MTYSCKTPTVQHLPGGLDAIFVLDVVVKWGRLRGKTEQWLCLSTATQTKTPEAINDRNKLRKST